MTADTPNSAVKPTLPPADQCEHAMQAINTAIPAEALERFCCAFERSACRWELVIYPAILALLFMVAGAFFFIYTLTQDMRQMAERMQPEIGEQLDRVAVSVQQLNTSINSMSENIRVMRTRIDAMSKDVNEVSKQMAHMGSMERQMAQMNYAIYTMAHNTSSMSWSVQAMNRSMRPMSTMSQFMPW